MILAAIQQRFHATVTGANSAGALDWPTEMQAGLAIYRTAYRARLLDCLRGAFDKCRKWIGDDSFEAAATHHLILHPPASWTLDDVGRGFSETLAALFPGDPEVEQLAWLEWELQQVFTSPDVPVLTTVDFGDRASAFTEEDWLVLRLIFVPAMPLRTITTDCAALWTAIDAGAEIPPLDLPGPKAVLLAWRQDLRSRFRLLDADEAAGLALMQAGASFEQLCAALVESSGEVAGVAAAGTMLGRWISDGLVIHAGSAVRPAGG